MATPVAEFNAFRWLLCGFSILQAATASEFLQVGPPSPSSSNSKAFQPGASEPFDIGPPSSSPSVVDQSLTIDEVILSVLKVHKLTLGNLTGPLPAVAFPPDARPPGNSADLWLAEYDMFLDSEQYTSLYGKAPSPPTTRTKRKIYKKSEPWTNGIVPYVINPWDFTGTERTIIHIAMREWEQYTCLKFVPANSSHVNKVILQNGVGCNSLLGMKGGLQTVNLESPGCRYKGLYIHELGHALGLVHEHQLPERDDYIDILWDNVWPGWREWFNKYEESLFDRNNDLQYDLASVMHYGTTAFSKDGVSRTIKAKDESQDYKIGRVYKKELSFADIKAINVMYQCASTCPSNVRCTSDGFVGKDCKCICADGSNRCQISPKLPFKPAPTCQNKHSSDTDCDQWAKDNECSLNPIWMIENCRSSCKKCDKIDEVTLPPKNCANRFDDSKCDLYAKAGECIANPAWMLYNCRGSCGWCSVTTNECRDWYQDTDQCLSWMNEGQCERNPGWMNANCRQTCGLCTNPPPGCTNKLGDDKCFADGSVGECLKNFESMANDCALACNKCGNCFNLFDDYYCEELSKFGECTMAPEWMNIYCKKACNACEKPIPPGVTLPCEDRASNCADLARTGECKENPTWMIANCQKSCDRCDCENKHSNGTECNVWAEQRECWANPNWMIPNCQRSCLVCTNLVPPSDRCVNKHDESDQCDKWAAANECFKNPLFMLPRCRKSCVNCEDDFQPETTTTTTTTTSTSTTTSTTTTITEVSPESCQNTHVSDAQCETWAKFGYCKISPGFMLERCQRSCDACIKTSTTSTTMQTPEPCVNTHSSDRECEGWARGGHCTRSPGFMLIRCKKACGRCTDDNISTTMKTPKPHTTTTSTCVNTFRSDSDCDMWAEAGHCKINPGFMLKRCAKSCNSC